MRFYRSNNSPPPRKNIERSEDWHRVCLRGGRVCNRPTHFRVRCESGACGNKQFVSWRGRGVRLRLLFLLHAPCCSANDRYSVVLTSVDYDPTRVSKKRGYYSHCLVYNGSWNILYKGTTKLIRLKKKGRKARFFHIKQPFIYIREWGCNR